MSAKSLEDLLNLPNQLSDTGSDLDKIKQALMESGEDVEETGDLADETAEVLDANTNKAISNLNDSEQKLTQLLNLNEYDRDVDILFDEAMDAFRTSFCAAKEVPAGSAGKIFEAASNFARLALDAKNSKIKAKLDVIDMSLKKQKLDLQAEKKEEKADTIDGKGTFLDRNELLKSLTEAIKEKDAEANK